MNGLRRHALAAGIALIAITNAVALGGAWYNRSGEPDSALQLTQRELAPPYWPGLGSEDGGLGLRLQWRILSRHGGDFFPGAGNDPEWLDRTKLTQLGFNVPLAEDPTQHVVKQRSRQVYVVLELDGPAYREALARAKRLLDNPPRNHPVEGPGAPGERLKREQTSASRLFIVDAGLDPAQLRHDYTDRTRYAIARARVHVSFQPQTATSPGLTSAFISNVLNDRVSVPAELRGVFDSLPRNYAPGQASTAGFEAKVAFGKRYEPWLVAAASAN